jgi:hypothetical protein
MEMEIENDNDIDPSTQIEKEKLQFTIPKKKVGIGKIIIGLIILSVIFAYLYYRYYLLEKERKHISMRILSHGGRIRDYFKPIPYVTEENKNKNGSSSNPLQEPEWFTINIKNKEREYLFIKHHNNDNKNNMWMTTTVVIFHGSTWSLPFLYEEYKKISETCNVNILSLEYPGFGNDNPQNISEQSLLHQYPLDLYHLINDELKCDWSRIILLGQCYGANPLLHFIRYHPWITKSIDRIIIIKPFTSWHNVMRYDILKHLFPDVLNLLTNPVLKKSLYNNDNNNEPAIKCPIYIFQGKADRICTEKNAKELFHKLTCQDNKKYFIEIPNVGHELSIFDCLTYIQSQ